MTEQTDAAIRPIRMRDRPGWERMFTAYREFYRLDADDAVVRRVWSWITDASHETNGLAAEAGGRLVGIAHFRAFARPSTGTTGLWLDDLFTDPAYRGQGIGRALIGRLQQVAKQDGYSVVRWITAADNHQARVLYDDVAHRTDWVTYDATPSTLTLQT